MHVLLRWVGSVAIALASFDTLGASACIVSYEYRVVDLQSADAPRVVGSSRSQALNRLSETLSRIGRNGWRIHGRHEVYVTSDPEAASEDARWIAGLVPGVVLIEKPTETCN